MNISFRVVWNRAMSAWTVVSELAHAPRGALQAATHSRTPPRNGLAYAVVLALGAMSAGAHAQTAAGKLGDLDDAMARYETPTAVSTTANVAATAPGSVANITLTAPAAPSSPASAPATPVRRATPAVSYALVAPVVASTPVVPESVATAVSAPVATVSAILPTAGNPVTTLDASATLATGTRAPVIPTGEQTSTSSLVVDPTTTKKTLDATLAADTSATTSEPVAASLTPSTLSANLTTASSLSTMVAARSLAVTTQATVTPLAIAPGDPRYPTAPEAATPGLVVGTGGLFGAVGAALTPTVNTLTNSSGYLTSGALNLAAANVTQAYVNPSLLGIGVVSLASAGQLTNNVTTGTNTHLTLLGGVTSASYITNLNRGTDSFSTNALGQVLAQAPAWASNCLDVLGVVTVKCWATNPAQDNQVIIGDKATANGSQEVVIGVGASHILPTEDANAVFAGNGRNDATNPSGVATNDYASRKGNSVVVGDLASGTANAQTIIGAGATSGQASSITLGNSSIGDRAAMNYSAPGVTGTQVSAGALSVGSTGAERQIVHVAAATDNYDAVNLLQLKGSVSAATQAAVKYNTEGTGNPLNAITLTGNNTGTPVSLGNVAATTLAANGTFAVNSGQLFATDTALTASLGGVAAFNAVTGVFTPPVFTMANLATNGTAGSSSYGDVTSALNAASTSLANVNTRVSNVFQSGLKYVQVNSAGLASAASATDSVAIGPGAVAGNTNSIALGANAATTVGAQSNYTASGLAAPQTSLGEVNIGTRKLTGVAAGSALTDAVNVAQLQGVEGGLGDLTNLAVRYSADINGNPLDTIALTGAGLGAPVGITNLAAGALAAGSTAAVNGAQLFATDSAVAGALGGTASFNATTGAFTAPSFAVTGITASGAVTTGNYNNVTSAFGAVNGSLTNLNTEVGNIYQTGTKFLQVNSTGTASVASGIDAVAVGPNAQASAANTLALGQGADASLANSIALGNGATTAVGARLNYAAPGLAIAQNSTGEVNIGSRQLTGVAAGSQLTDAVNVAQLQGVSTGLTDLANLAVHYNVDGSGNPLNSITLDGTGLGANVGIDHLAAGQLAAGSTAAVNGAQLFATDNAIVSALGGTAGFNAATGVFTAPTFALANVAANGTVSSQNYATVSAAVGALDGSLVNVNARIDAFNTTGAKYFHANSVGGDSVASGADSVAVGSLATASQAGAVAVGAGAHATLANSVALGAGSATTVGANVGYTGYGLALPQTSAGEVNVGNRQVTGVAAGSADADAVNVAQLRAVDQSVGGLGALAVKYDAGLGGAPTNHVTFTGDNTGAAVVLDNVANGALAPSSRQAVNGGQLLATNVALAGYIGAGAAFSPVTGVFTAPNFAVSSVSTSGAITTNHYGTVGDALGAFNGSVTNVSSRIDNLLANGMPYVHVNSVGVDGVASAVDAIAIGANAVADAANSVALGAGSSTATGALSNYTAYGLSAPQTSMGEVNIGNRQLTGVAAGVANQDAVNVEQLRAVSTSVGDLGLMAVKYDNDGAGNPLPRISFNGGSGGVPVALANVAAGQVAAGSTDGINAGQLYTTNTSLAQFFGGVAAFNTATGFTAPNFSVMQVAANGGAALRNFSNVTDAFGAVSGSLGNINARIASLAAGVASPYVAVNSSSAPAAQALGTDAVAVGGGTSATVDNAVAVGMNATVSAAGGVALGQGAVADRAGGAIAAFTGAVTPDVGAVSVGSAGLERQITNVAGGTADTDAVNVAQLSAVDNRITTIGATTVQYDSPAMDTVSLNRAGTLVRLTGLTAGAVTASSTDAITGAQFYAATQDTSNPFSNRSLYARLTTMSSGGGTTSAPLDFAVNDTNSYDPATATGTNSMSAGAGASATGANSIASGNNAKATAANAVALGNASVADRANTVSVGAAGAERQVTNVAAGTASTDAVNMAQLTQAASETAHYDTNADGTINYNSFSVGKANLAPAVIHNVADGTLDTDAANVGQLNQVADWSKAYTDSRVSAINQDIQRANSRASAGVASAMAMAGLPQAYEPGRNMAAVAGGSYRGESSMAIGVSMISDNGRWVYKLNGTTNTRGDGGVSIGAGMQW